MIMFTLPTRTPLVSPGAPMTPARYLRLRREAAGLTIEDLARSIAPRERDRSHCAGMLRLLETPGAVARQRDLLDRFAALMPIDADVYFQLAHEPADRHPMVCQRCGCSGNDPCTGSRGICTAVTAGACSRCVDDDLASVERAA